MEQIDKEIVTEKVQIQDLIQEIASNSKKEAVENVDHPKLVIEKAMVRKVGKTPRRFEKVLFNVEGMVVRKTP